MSREQFASGVKALYEMQDGYYNSPNEYRTAYRDGFFTALSMWLSGAYSKIPPDVGDTDFDARGGFRYVVDAWQDDYENESEQFCAGYQQALRIFQEAKGL